MNAAITPADTPVVAVWPGTAPRLLRLTPGVEEYAEYAGGGGYQALDDPDRLLDEVERSGLLGRGGAAFPLAVKLRTVRDAGRAGGHAVVLANGEEGEPASVKDKWLLRNRPHLVLDGVRLAARVVGAQRAVVYVSDPLAAQALDSALAAADLDLSIGVVTVDAGYVAGEETAAVRADQRWTGQADRQATPAVPRRRRRPADARQQRRDACQPAVRPPPRRRGVPRRRYRSVAWNIPGHGDGRR